MPKAKDTLIDSQVSLRQCKHAVEALHTHTFKKEQKAAESELLPGKVQHVWLQVAVKQMQPEKKLKPRKIPIVHPLVDPRTTAICLITKDPQREYKNLLESHGIKFISRVVGVTKLKGKFKPYDARRMLLQENGMFLADDRIVPLLPALLGSKWFDAKKQPIPVCLTRKDLKGELERAISSTYMHQNQGTCTSIKIATTTQSTVQTLANLETALPAIVANIKGGWDNIQSLHLKTGESVALPLWTCGLAEEGRWAGMVKDDENAGEVDEDDGDSEDGVKELDMDVDEVVVKGKKETVKKAKGTKRPAEEEAQEEEKPKKKAKGTKRPSEEEAQKLEEEKSKKKAKPESIQQKSDSEENTGSPVSLLKKKRKASLVSEPAQEPQTPISVVAPIIDDNASKKRKKRKSIVETTPAFAGGETANDVAPAPLLDDAIIPAPTDASEDSEKKKKRKRAKVAVDDKPSPDPVPVADATPIAADAPSKKPRQRKAKAAVDDKSSSDPVPVADTIPIAADAPGKKPRKRKAKAAVDDKPSHDPVPVSDATPIAADAPGKKLRKKRSRASLADADTEISVPPTSNGLTKEELKQKRVAEGGERKKDKVVKKTGKSTKDAILGRKAGQA